MCVCLFLCVFVQPFEKINATGIDSVEPGKARECIGVANLRQMKFHQMKFAKWRFAKFWTKKKKKSFVKNVKKRSFVKNGNKKFVKKKIVLPKKQSFVKNVLEKQVFSQNIKKLVKKLPKFFEVKFGEAKLIIGVVNVICGEATWSPLIKTAFGSFNQLV